MEKYFLRTLLSPSFLEISAAEFSAVKKGMEKLHALLKLTENYEMVVESFKDFEQAKFSEELRSTLYRREDYQWTYHCRLALNTRLYGYLSSASYFNDSANKILKKLLSREEIEQFKKKRSEIADSTWGYRFSESLRNYALHYATPIHIIGFGMRWDGDLASEDAHLVRNMQLSIPKQALQNDRVFQNSVLEGLPDPVNILAAIRSHMEGVWMLHTYLTEKLSATATTSRENINRVLQSFPDKKISYLKAMHESSGTIVEEFPILLKWDDVRIARIKKLGNLKNLSKSYISGKL